WPWVGGNLGWPFQGMLWRWTHLTQPGGLSAGLVHVAGMSLLSMEVVLALIMCRLRTAWLACALALVGAGLAILRGESTYLNGWSYNRVFVFLPLGIGLWALQTNHRWALGLMSAAAIWPILAVVQVWVR